MEEEINGEFRIVGYVDDIEDSVFSAEKRDMPEELINDMNALHDDIVELEPLLSAQEHYDRLNEAVEKLIDELVEKCRGDDAAGAAEMVKKLNANVDGLKKYLMEHKQG